MPGFLPRVMVHRERALVADLVRTTWLGRVVTSTWLRISPSLVMFCWMTDPGLVSVQLYKTFVIWDLLLSLFPGPRHCFLECPALGLCVPHRPSSTLSPHPLQYPVTGPPAPSLPPPSHFHASHSDLFRLPGDPILHWLSLLKPFPIYKNKGLKPCRGSLGAAMSGFYP